jgi:hypothetical protein
MSGASASATAAAGACARTCTAARLLPALTATLHVLLLAVWQLRAWSCCCCIVCELSNCWQACQWRSPINLH